MTDNNEAKKNTSAEISEDVYGITKNGRTAISYIITALIILAVISCSFALAVYMPGDNDALESQAAVLRDGDEEYEARLEERDALKESVDKLHDEIEAKRQSAQELENYENTMADMRMKKKTLREEYNSLSAQKKEKQVELDSLNASISQKEGAITEYAPGEYIAGDSIPLGKFSVVGSGKLQVATGSGKSKTNVILSGTPTEITLEKDDIVRIYSTTKFTPIG